MKSSAELFAVMGDPWVTPEDWLREEKLAQNPRAATREMESARAFTAKARKRDVKRAQPKPEFWEISQKSPRSAEVLRKIEQRDNFKAMLAGLGACERTIVPAAPKPERPVRVLSSDEEMRFRNTAGDRPEPITYAPAKPLGGSHAENVAKQRAHWLDLRKEWQKSHDRAVETDDALGVEKALARLHAIGLQLSKLA